MGDPRGRAGAPDRVDAGYRQFQRTLARTTDNLDLHRLLPRMRRRLPRHRPAYLQARPLVGIATVLAITGAVIFLLMGSDDGGTARLGSTVIAGGEARPVSLTISSGFTSSGAFTQEPVPLPDPNTGEPGAASLLDQALDPFSIRPGGAAGSPAGTEGGPAAAATGTGATGANAVLAVPQISRLYTLTNQERAERGLRPVALDASLNATAQRHADWMAQAGVLCHASECHPSAQPDTGVWNGWGENIGYSVQDSADGLQQAFLESPPHLANMVDPRHRYVGFGWSRGYNRDAGTTVYYVVVQFGMNRR